MSRRKEATLPPTPATSLCVYAPVCESEDDASAAKALEYLPPAQGHRLPEGRKWALLRLTLQVALSTVGKERVPPALLESRAGPES